MKIHAGHIEVAVAKLLDFRVYTIVPNVSWGLGLNHECDLLALDGKNRFTEIEIKISASDLRADFYKNHGHKSKYISRLVYALPQTLYEKHGSIIPARCGVIVVRNVSRANQDIPMWKAFWERKVKHDNTKPEPPEHIIAKFKELGCMRIWSLKEQNHRLQNRVKEKPEIV